MAAPEPPLVPSFPMTDLEAELMAPGAQAVQAALVARFEALQARIRETMDAGLAPAEFARAQAIGNALAAAKEVVLILR
ncbi:MAG: Type secretion system, cytoplasmic component of needle [Hyphomicrobiales bacterium]|jgi:hypothetical protein